MTFHVQVDAHVYVVDDACVVEVVHDRVRIYKRGAQAASQAVSNEAGASTDVVRERPRTQRPPPRYAVEDKQVWGRRTGIQAASTREEYVQQVLDATKVGGTSHGVIGLRGLTLNTNTGLTGKEHLDYMKTVLREMTDEGLIELFYPSHSTQPHYRIPQQKEDAAD